MAVLSLLVEQPSYVYDVAKRYDDRFGDLIPRSHTTIYRVVDVLEQNGMLEGMGGPGPRRKNYRVTGDGARAYTTWLTQQLSSQPERIEMATRMLAGATSGGEGRVLAVLDSYERDCLEEATRLPPRPANSEAANLTTLLGQLLEEERRLAIGVRLQWIRYARAHIQRLAQRPGSVGDE